MARPPGDDGLSSTARALRAAQPYMDASWQLVGAVALCTFAGWWADGRFGTAPWLLLSGAVLGIVVGFVTFIRVVLRLGEIDRKAREARGKEDGPR